MIAGKLHVNYWNLKLTTGMSKSADPLGGHKRVLLLFLFVLPSSFFFPFLIPQIISFLPLPLLSFLFSSPSSNSFPVDGGKLRSGGVKLHICCCLSGVRSPSVRCVSVAVGVALVWPQVGSDKRTLRPDICGV